MKTALLLLLSFLTSVHAHEGQSDAEDQRGYVGIYVADADGEGVLVSGVMEGLAGAKAGLAAGDVIVSVGGAGIGDFSDLEEALAKRRPGEAVVVTVRRDGDVQELPVVLSARPGTARREAEGAHQPWREVLERLHRDSADWNEVFEGRMRELQGELEGRREAMEHAFRDLARQLEPEDGGGMAGRLHEELRRWSEERGHHLEEARRGLRRLEESRRERLDGLERHLRERLGRRPLAPGNVFRVPALPRVPEVVPEGLRRWRPARPEGFDASGVRRGMEELREQLGALREELAELRESLRGRD